MWSPLEIARCRQVLANATSGRVGTYFALAAGQDPSTVHMVGSVKHDRVELLVPRVLYTGYHSALRGRLQDQEGATLLSGRFGPSRFLFAAGAIFLAAMVISLVVIPGGWVAFPLPVVVFLVIYGPLATGLSTRDRARIGVALHDVAGFQPVGDRH